MADFGIRFFVCNIFICVIIGILLLAKRVFRNYLTSRMQFNLWFLLLGLLAVPFLPIRPIEFPQIFLWFGRLFHIMPTNPETVAETINTITPSGTTSQINDFALSVSSRTPSIIGLILFRIWLIGIIGMCFLVVKSNARLNTLKKSALPLQNKNVRLLYKKCLIELKIKKNIPIYSTAFLKSPIIVGLFQPCIYLPIHLISDFTTIDFDTIDSDAANFDAADSNGINLDVIDFHTTDFHAADSVTANFDAIDFHATDMRYMLLHELQHYKHKDALAGYFMNLVGILYWFNPLVWFALKEMRNDREIACDTSVLKLLKESDYIDYGNTLINFAEKISITSFPFPAGISGNMKQMQKRILHISSYQKPSVWRKLKGFTAFSLIAVILFGLTPMLSTYAADSNYYRWKLSSEKISIIDLSAYFNGYKGSFVLYDRNNDRWNIYNLDYATLRTAPNSTCKIYHALFGLEEGIITPEDSFLTWDETDYPFEAWNLDHNLYSAMRASVNWYFQEIEEQLGIPAIKKYIRKIGYGNEYISSNLSSYQMQSSLKISPVEQVELLTDLCSNRFGFIPENINAVKDAICLFSSENKNFYGKTGTGRIDGQDVNGWFIGFLEMDGNTYFFATNIQSDTNAAGSNAAEITKSILLELKIWEF